MVCKLCEVEKAENDFYSGKNGYIDKVCKSCRIIRNSENQKKNKEQRRQYCKEYAIRTRAKRIESDNKYREKINNLKTPCMKCGEKRLYVLDFHHINPEEKSFNINRKSCKNNFEIVENEIKKCICLCRNCHMEFHYFYGIKPKDPINSLKKYLKGEKNNESN